MLVTDRRRFGGDVEALDRVVGLAVRAARAGVTLVQIREEGLDDRTLIALVERILSQTADTPTRVVVNERIDIALSSGAHGVHLPADGMSATRARQIVPQGHLLGRSVHSADEAARAASAGGCDYLVFGTVFPTSSKPDGHPVAGPAALADACRAVDLPILAIGGITAERFEAVARTGAAGIAAIGLFVDESPAALERLLARLADAYAQRAAHHPS
jgi:thiamine-phosphate pyrophosphorylase